MLKIWSAGGIVCLTSRGRNSVWLRYSLLSPLVHTTVSFLARQLSMFVYKWGNIRAIVHA